jgi:hypothetical protein
MPKIILSLANIKLKVCFGSIIDKQKPASLFSTMWRW